uniref:Uncharacterized protein n=1 Tax=Arundo donax TaxID=35708 RepID=A0A0A9C299_ARUDO
MQHFAIFSSAIVFPPNRFILRFLRLWFYFSTLAFCILKM